MKKITVEVCCGSAGDVYEAAKAGADRVELNCALNLGGLTPSIGEMIKASEADIEIFTMIRPREGGFCYNDIEFSTMLHDTHCLLEAGADGIVFGILNADGTVDQKRCAQLIEAAAGKPAVFHRAFDVTPDWRYALDALCSLGFCRILTSGQAASAADGATLLGEMVEYAAGRIEILPGAGIRAHNVHDIIQKTKCDQVHVSMRAPYPDHSCMARPEIHFGGTLPPDELSYSATDRAKLSNLIEMLSL